MILTQEQTNVDLLYLQQGCVLFGNAIVPILKNKQRIGTGSVYTHGNRSRSFVNLTNFGTLMGNNPLPIGNELAINNYLTALIPGMYPTISGPFDVHHNYYNLQSLLEQKKPFVKVLGLGIGELYSFRVADVSKNALGLLSQNSLVERFEGSTTTFQTLKQPNYSTMLENNLSPLTITGTNPYLSNFNWEQTYGIKMMNGTNTFPTFGWAGARLGSLRPVIFQNQQDALYNYPSYLLELTRTYEPIGIIYAGQGVQLTNYPSKIPEQIIEFNRRNRLSFETSIRGSTFPTTITGIQPYQQGRGIYEYVNREVTYTKESGNVDTIEFPTTYGPEGAQPGRNNAFIGCALTDHYKKQIDLNNQESSSRTPNDTRKVIPGEKQTKTAHNAPLAFTADDESNTINPLPWNSTFAYVGNTTSSASNLLSDNTPILTDGITTMVVSGAYPLYRASNETEYSGLTGPPNIFRFTATYLSQYYTTNDFWNPNLDAPIPPAITSVIPQGGTIPVPPNPPYQIKGGRIVLYEHQRVTAGSYVYSTVHLTGNVNVSQFYGAAAKELNLNRGNQSYILQDPYTKYQSNQGGLIVMVTNNYKDPNAEPPIPPSGAQPVGIVLEDIYGTGTPPEINHQIIYQQQSKRSVAVQIIPDFEKTFQLQCRQILVRLFPMYANLSLSGFSNFQFDGNGFPLSTSLSFDEDDSNVTNSIPPSAFISYKIRTLYTLHDSGSAFLSFFYPFVFYDTSIKGKQFMNDYIGPEAAKSLIWRSSNTGVDILAGEPL